MNDNDKCFILTVINQQVFKGFCPAFHHHLIQDACVLPLFFPTFSTDTHLPPRTSWWGHEGYLKSAAGAFPMRSWARVMTSPCSLCHWRVTSLRHDRDEAPPRARPQLLTPSELWMWVERAGEEEVLKATWVCLHRHTFIKPAEQTRSLPSPLWQPSSTRKVTFPPLDMSFVVVSPGENWICVVLLFPVYVFNSKPGDTFQHFDQTLYFHVTLLHVAPIFLKMKEKSPSCSFTDIQYVGKGAVKGGRKRKATKEMLYIDTEYWVEQLFWKNQKKISIRFMSVR